MPAQPKSTTGPRVMTVRELAAYLRVHQTTVYRLLREQKLPAFRVGADWRFEREEIERWMTHEQKRFAFRVIEPPPSRNHCRRMGNPISVRRRVGPSKDINALAGERRRLQGEKAALAEIPKCTVGAKSLDGLISGADSGDGGRQ